ncbi:response regulator transcription factor [Streptomyces anulatus]|uniref:response regulator transcription factor n=1 Tax=Streptomyces anulatus TaxID=1892 RepID=UPI00368E4283
MVLGPGGSLSCKKGPAPRKRCGALRRVVLLDIDLPGADGITVAAGLVERLPACRVLMLTALDRPGHLRRALAAGAAGYLLKSTTPARTAGGAHSREIAADLFLSVGTVRSRLSSAVGKLHARTLVDAARIAKDQGWV